MSEKRYEVDYEVGVLDTKTNEIICETINAVEVVDLLNELSDEKGQLKEENERLRQQLKTKVIVNRQYEEKERLKKENRVLKKDLNKLYNLLIDKGMSHNELQDVLWGIDDE